MFDLISKIFFKSTVYVQFSASYIKLKHVEKGKIIEDKPIIALKNKKNGKKTIVAFGKAAETARLSSPEHIALYNAFDHPRTFISNFEIAQATLRAFCCELFQRKVLLGPVIVFHPLEKIDGGITQIEHRGLIELGETTGAREAYVWVGRDLSDNELLSLNFPEKEGVSGYSNQTLLKKI